MDIEQGIEGGNGRSAVRGRLSPDEISLEFDPRLADVWLAILQAGIEPTPELACVVRMAYLRGYQDALVEPERGELFTRMGLPVPPKPRSKTASTTRRKGGQR